MKFKFGNTCFLPVLIGIVIFAVLGPFIFLVLGTIFIGPGVYSGRPEPTLAAMAVPTKSSSGSGIN
jgi:hypothetical protein